MFADCTIINGPANIDTRNTANVTKMNNVFQSAYSFNQPIGNWNMANVTNMYEMFNGVTSFNQSLGSWTLNSNVYLSHMLDNSGMDCSNYSSTLIAWANSPNTPNNKTLEALGLPYGINAQASRAHLINSKGWAITNDNLTNGCCTSNITVFQASCNSFTFNGQTFTSSGVYTDNFVTSLGCDSIVQLNLTIYNSCNTTINQTACDSYSFNGLTYTSGVYYDTLANSFGCGSLLTLNLTITNLNISITQSGYSIWSNAIVAVYQWILCDKITIISGATNQVYVPIINGNYAVIVNQNGCIDTSDCVTVLGLGVDDYTNNWFSITPSPNNGKFVIENISSENPFSLKILSITGQEVYSIYEPQLINPIEIDISNQAAGIYIIEMLVGNQLKRVKMLKQ